MMSFKIGVIGCGGFAGYVHGPAQARYAALRPEIELTACCDLDAEKARSYAGKFGFQRHYQSCESMLDREDLDAVFLLVAPRCTAEIAAEIIKRGVPILLEKPPGMTSDDLEILIQIAVTNAVPVQVAFNRRYMPVMVQARNILDRDFPPIMDIHYEMVRFGRDDPDFSTTAIHALDAVQFLAGSPYRRAQIHFGEIPGIRESRSNLHISAECESGVWINIHIQPMAGFLSETFSVHGVGSSLKAHLFGPGGSRSSGRLVRWEADIEKSVFTDERFSHGERLGIDGEIAAFCEALREGIAPTPTLQEARFPVRLMEAIRNREDQPIILEQPQGSGSKEWRMTPHFLPVSGPLIRMVNPRG